MLSFIMFIAYVVFLYLIYAPLAELLFHLGHVGTFYRGAKTERKVALTFDDGPDPAKTPQVLEILKAAQVKATFFLVGSKAVAHPALVRQMVEDGHQVASHSYLHRHAWLRGPIQTFRDIALAKEELERLSGLSVSYYRPPWGAFNWVVRAASSHLGLTPVLWSVRAMDWLAKTTPKEIVENIATAAEPGSVILCHDAGGEPGAPANTIEALPEVIAELKALGFSFASIHELHEEFLEWHRGQANLYAGYPLRRRFLIALWQPVELAFSRIYRVQTVNEIFRISETTWNHGPRFDSGSGRLQVKDGCKGIDLHFQNSTLIAISSAKDNRALVHGLRMVRAGLSDLARILEHHPRYQHVEVIAAHTLMNRGIEMLGFHVEELPQTRQTRSLQRYMRFLMGMYHPAGFRRLSEGTQSLTLKRVWMSREEVIQMYGKKQAHEGAGAAASASSGRCR